MSDLTLVRGRWVITGDGAACATITGGAVLVDGDRIRAVGDAAALLDEHPQATVLGGDDVAVLPGLVNAHHHTHGASTVQHGIADALLEPWILSFACIRRSDVYLDTLLGAARQLKSGVTTVVDVHSAGGNATAYADALRRKLRAYAESGLRVALAAGVRTQSFLVHGSGEDRKFLDSLPPELGARARQLLPAARMSDDEYLDLVEAAARDYADHACVDVWFGPPGPQWVSDTLMQRIAERAQALDTGIQTHCNESIYEMMHAPREHGKSSIAHLLDLRVLGPRFSLAHGVWLSEREIALLAETGAAVSHNPSSNLRLRAGIAPLNALLGAGVTTGLGMDGTTLNEDEDMFTEMRLAMRLHRTPMLGTPAPTPAQVLGMASAGGAKLMRKGHLLGRLAPGFKADVVLVDLQRITWPWVAPETDPAELVLMRARADDVRTVLVDGRVVLDEGLPTRFDLNAAARELARALDASGYPREAARLVGELTPHMETWYERWKVPPLEPWIRYNSRG